MATSDQTKGRWNLTCGPPYFSIDHRAPCPDPWNTGCLLLICPNSSNGEGTRGSHNTNNSSSMDPSSSPGPPLRCQRRVLSKGGFQLRFIIGASKGATLSTLEAENQVVGCGVRCVVNGLFRSHNQSIQIQKTKGSFLPWSIVNLLRYSSPILDLPPSMVHCWTSRLQVVVKKTGTLAVCSCRPWTVFDAFV